MTIACDSDATASGRWTQVLYSGSHLRKWDGYETARYRTPLLSETYTLGSYDSIPLLQFASISIPIERSTKNINQSLYTLQISGVIHHVITVHTVENLSGPAASNLLGLGWLGADTVECGWAMSSFCIFVCFALISDSLTDLPMRGFWAREVARMAAVEMQWKEKNS